MRGAAAARRPRASGCHGVRMAFLGAGLSPPRPPASSPLRVSLRLYRHATGANLFPKRLSNQDVRRRGQGLCGDFATSSLRRPEGLAHSRRPVGVCGQNERRRWDPRRSEPLWALSGPRRTVRGGRAPLRASVYSSARGGGRSNWGEARAKPAPRGRRAGLRRGPPGDRSHSAPGRGAGTARGGVTRPGTTEPAPSPE